MWDIRKILVPVVLGDISPQVAKQADYLRRQFGAEINLLNVLPSGKHGAPRDVETIRQAQDDLDRSLRDDITGNAVVRLVRIGDSAQEIIRTANEQDSDLIVMATHRRWRIDSTKRSFYRFCLGSITARVLQGSRRRIWVGAQLATTPSNNFEIRHILCLVDFTWRSRRTASQAAEIAATFGAKLSLVYITASAEFFSPGKAHIDPVWRDVLTGYAKHRIDILQKIIGTNADVIVGSGSVAEALNDVATEANADLLVMGNFSAEYSWHENQEAFDIIRCARIPILSI